MKLAFCLLALVVAVQARSTGLESPITALSTAENPWVVHLRIAVTNGAGLLNSCVGSLVNERWVLTSASCVREVRFVWIRYGATKVVNPELVTETSVANTNGDLALVSINRVVHSTPTIGVVELTDSVDLPETGILCGYGSEEDGSAGETLRCFELKLEGLEGDLFEGVSEDVQATEFDVGAPLVSDGVQIGVLLRPAANGANAVFVSVAGYKSWVQAQTGTRV